MNFTKKNIFISIAAYRDSEIIPTLISCFKNADRPERVWPVIAWQYRDNESLKDFFDSGLLQSCRLPKEQVTVISIPAQLARGACWARALIQECYNPSFHDYFLQIDSHSRFAYGWDTKVINHYQKMSEKVDKLVLTGYPAGYSPDQPESSWGKDNLKIRICGMSYYGLPYTYPEVMSSSIKQYPLGEPARFLGAGFIFSQSDFVNDVPYDPELFFFGEELNISYRAFTKGYNLYHPRAIFVWHYYTRKDSPHIWNDSTTWSKIDQASLHKMQTLLHLIPFEEDKYFDFHDSRYSLGNIRSFEEYERYMGIDFGLRGVQRYTIQGLPPPTPRFLDAKWEDTLLFYPNKDASVFG